METNARVVISSAQGDVEGVVLQTRGDQIQCEMPDGRKIWMPESSVQPLSVPARPVSQAAAPPPSAAAPVPRAAKTGTNWGVIALICVGVAVPVFGVLASLAIYGVQKYVSNAKGAQTRANLEILADDLCSCADETGRLPASGGPIPEEVPSARKVMSSRREWAAAGFCNGGLSAPHYAQFEWVPETSGTGTIYAEADLDGDGEVEPSEPSFMVPITMQPSVGCTVGQVTRFE